MKVDPSWLTPAVLGLAQEIESLTLSTEGPNLGPILADALEEAGCTEELILSHLRNLPNSFSDKHYKGCWVAEVLLGKRTGPPM